VNLSGVDAADVSRGQILVVPETLATTDVIDAEITLLEGAPPLKPRARVHLHAFTSEAMTSVILYSSEPMKPGATRLARLKLSSPIVFAPEDRFVLRQPLPAGTFGGGRVLDANPLSQARRAATQKWLESLAQAAPAQQLELRVQRRGMEGIRADALGCEMGLKAEAVRQIAASVGELIMLPGVMLISREAYSTAVDSALTRLKDAGPQGLKRAMLQSQLRMKDEIFGSVMNQIVGEGYAQIRGEVITIAGAAPAISDKDTQKLYAVSASYRSAGLAPPSVREAARQLRMEEPEIRRLITLLIRDKTLVRMGSDDAFLHADVLRELRARLGTKRGDSIDVAAFKAMTGLTRKHAIPLLELLDRERITRKQGDVRVVL
jgi:selenocysteine-specific elongation factor